MDPNNLTRYPDRPAWIQTQFSHDLWDRATVAGYGKGYADAIQDSLEILDEARKRAQGEANALAHAHLVLDIGTRETREHPDTRRKE